MCVEAGAFSAVGSCHQGRAAATFQHYHLAAPDLVRRSKRNELDARDRVGTRPRLDPVADDVCDVSVVLVSPAHVRLLPRVINISHWAREQIVDVSVGALAFGLHVDA